MWFEKLASAAGRLNLIASIALMVFVVLTIFVTALAPGFSVKYLILAVITSVLAVFLVSFVVRMLPNIPGIMTVTPFLFEWAWVKDFGTWSDFSVWCWLVALSFLLSTLLLITSFIAANIADRHI